MAAGAEPMAGLRVSRRWWPSDIALVHGSAAVVALVSAFNGRLPFLWVADTVAHRPSWVGLVVAWVVITAAYLFAWRTVARFSAVQVLLTVAMSLNAVWAIFVLLAGALQVSGLGVNGLLVGTLPWVARIVVAVACLVGLAGYVRLGRAAAESDLAKEEALGDTTAPPAALVVSVVGLLVAAWSLALLAPPQATPASATSAVLAATSDTVDTRDVVRFQGSLDDVIEKQMYVHPRDGWTQMRGFFSSGGKVVYDNSVQWGVMVLYRDQITCVLRDVSSHQVVVRSGYCPG